MNEQIKKLNEERKRRNAITLRNEKADRIPTVAWRSDYLIYYYGQTQSEIDNYDKMVEIYKKANEEFSFDVCDVMDPILLTYPKNGALMRGSMYHLNDDHNAVQIDPSKVEIMTPEDYDSYIANPTKCLANELLPRRYGLLGADVPKEEKFAAFDAMNEMRAQSGAFRQKVADETGFVGSAHIFYTMPVDEIFDFLRNFTGIIMDIRRCPEKLIAASEVLTNTIVKDIKASPVLDYSTATAALHLAPFLKPKDFEKVYWPSFKTIVTETKACGTVTKLLFEKSWKHLFDYLDELPDNSVCGYFEKEDGFENVCNRFNKKMIIAGGIETQLLARGTKDQCVDQVKHVIDTCCQDGGVFLAPDLPMVYAVDAIPENFKAVMDTIKEYGNY